jgi:hypothetical protein
MYLLLIVLAKKHYYTYLFSPCILKFTYLDHVKILVGHNFNLFGVVIELMMCMVKQMSFYREL